ncbi:MAG: hypothetical protein IJF11_05675 [Clostridia bacterium]|nr:hypothetical protein [Clostridia bacterium]
MKKLLSILLTLVFCLGIFVSCDNETPTESSSESAKAIEYVDYYYFETIYKEPLVVSPVADCRLIKDYSELQALFEEYDYTKSYITEKDFEENIVLFSTITPSGDSFLGYCNFSSNDEGSTIESRSRYFNAFDYKYKTGEKVYGAIYLDAVNVTTRYYEVILVPKSELTRSVDEEEKIQIKRTFIEEQVVIIE